MDSYKTIKFKSNDEYIIKKSRFIGYICPVKTQEDAVAFINEISKKHWDATHNVYAYILKDSNTKRFSDDGEPQGTAGIPVLDVLEKNNLTDCCVVVTRYFGGIMLGAGGLVRAYSHTASLAVAAGVITLRALCARMKISCDYYFYGKLASMVPEFKGIIEDTTFEDSVIMTFHIPKEKTNTFIAQLVDASNGKYRPEIIDEFFDDIE